MKFLMIRTTGNNLDPLVRPLAECGPVHWADSPDAALAAVKQIRPQVVVVDMEQNAAVELIKNVVRHDPFINCAMTSPLPAEDFHEATEGLGVFMQLPENPGEIDARKLLDLLKSIGVAIEGGSEVDH
jgi:hypothetical protein